MAPDLQATIQSAAAAEAGVAQRLKQSRQKIGLTQDQLAQLAGTKQAVIQKIENAHSTRPRCLGALAAVLNVNPAWLAWGEPYAAREVEISQKTALERLKAHCLSHPPK